MQIEWRDPLALSAAQDSLLVYGLALRQNCLGEVLALNLVSLHVIRGKLLAGVICSQLQKGISKN